MLKICLCKYLNKSVKLHGIQHFGSEGHEYAVSTEVKDTTNNFTLPGKENRVLLIIKR